MKGSKTPVSAIRLESHDFKPWKDGFLLGTYHLRPVHLTGQAERL